MQTRSGFCYPNNTRNSRAKRRRLYGAADYFDRLPDDLVVAVLCKLSSSAASSADLIGILITCKRMKELGQCPQVLQRASPESLTVRAKSWSDGTHRFLQRCVDAGNLGACYTLGMIRFYCLGNRGSGAALMARAAIRSHAAAIYSLAVIKFNGSGGSKDDKDLRAGVALCTRAASLGHIDALRELGHCLQDGYGVRGDIAAGRRLLVQANARELHAVLSTAGGAAQWLTCWPMGPAGCPLLSDYGYDVPPAEARPVNHFMAEWFGERGGVEGEGMRVCSNAGCGRPETRRHEFRRCSACGAVNYCSRACQALHWKHAHKFECTPVNRLALNAAAVPVVVPPTEAARRSQ